MALAIIPSVVSIPPNSKTAALEMASASVSGPAPSASTAPPTHRLGQHRLGQHRASRPGRDDLPEPGGQRGECGASGGRRVSGLIGPGPGGGPLARRAARGCGFGLHGRHDPVVPAEDRSRIGLPQPEGLRHDRRGQRPGHGAAQLGRASRPDGGDQPAGLVADERFEPGMDLIGPERARERSPVAGMLRAVQ